MQSNKNRMLLVGDNPFHGISHLSQERVRDRGKQTTDPKFAASLVAAAVENGANGFMFSVSETTLSILKSLNKDYNLDQIDLYALVPYAFEYVRLATHFGGISGLGRNVTKQILRSGNFPALMFGLKGILTTDVVAIMKAYLEYEISRVKSSIKKKGILRSVLLHEVITDMSLALNIDLLFRSYIKFLHQKGIEPGFETRNFPYLVKKFNEWGINTEAVLIATPFNKMGFYMNPSKAECEIALSGLPRPNVIAMSVLAAGYIKPAEAIDYIDSLPNLSGIVIGVSKEQQARELSTFLEKNRLEITNPNV